MTNLAQRVRRDEQMDQPGLDAAVYEEVLRDLSRVNRWTLAARPTLEFLQRTAVGTGSFRLLDVGFGHGDMLRRIAAWARKRNLSATLVGVDINARSVDAARKATAADLDIEFIAGDYRDLPGSFDFIISSLVTHHMDDVELTTFLRFMEDRSRRGWFINDLHRHRAAHLFYPLLARLIGTHRIVREDGTLSIARSFRPADWKRLLQEAGIQEGTARISRHFPFRLCVERLF